MGGLMKYRFPASEAAPGVAGHALGNLLIAALYGGEYRIPPAVFWLLAVAAGLRLIRAVPSTALMALEKTRLLMLSNLPRLATLPLALFAVTLGGGLAAVAAIGVVGEALGLAVTLFLMSASRSRFSDVAASRLVEEV